MSLEMAHKVIVPQKKIMSRSFLNSGTLIVIIALPKFYATHRNYEILSKSLVPIGQAETG